MYGGSQCWDEAHSLFFIFIDGHFVPADNEEKRKTGWLAIHWRITYSIGSIRFVPFSFSIIWCGTRRALLNKNDRYQHQQQHWSYYIGIIERGSYIIFLSRYIDDIGGKKTYKTQKKFRLYFFYNTVLLLILIYVVCISKEMQIGCMPCIIVPYITHK